MRRNIIAYAASALLHGLLIGVLASSGWDEALWRHAVESGQPIMLVASLGPASPEAAPVPVVEIAAAPAPTETEAAEFELQREVETLEPPKPLKEPLPEQTPLLAPQLPRPTPPREECLAEPPQQDNPPQLARRPPIEPSAPTAIQAEVLSAAPPSVQVLSAGAEVDQPPQKLPTNPAPDYPLAARLAGWEGRVLLRVIIDSRGRVQEVLVHESSGYALLDESALRTVRQWRFTAARRGPLAVESEVIVPIRFSLRRG